MSTIIKIRDFIKKKSKTHTIDSAQIFPDELTIEELDIVIGGMSRENFENWRIDFLNKIQRERR
tara:strand:+ start:128 stop:319 length:192 start_codon:yes stop_codon:yes gene_type:complete